MYFVRPILPATSLLALLLLTSCASNSAIDQSRAFERRGEWQRAFQVVRDEYEARAGPGARWRYTSQSALASIGVAMENIAAAESTIRNTDYGQEVANLTRLQILDLASLSAIKQNTAASARILDLFA